MAQALQPIELPKSRFAAKFEEQTNVVPNNITVPSLSYTGKTWSISLNGEKKKVTKVDKDSGETVPVSIMNVVVVDWNKDRGRAYYANGYDPENIAMPECWSDDSKLPSASVPAETKKASACTTCPLAVKGSKVTDRGTSVAACGQHRMLAVIPAAALDMTPLRMKIAVTSDYDGKMPELEAQGWYAWKGYVDMLNARGVMHTAQVVTKMKFDPNKEYPKVVFKAGEPLTDDNIELFFHHMDTPELKQLISGSYTPNGVDGTRIEGPAPQAQVTVDAAANAAAVAAQAAADAVKAQAKIDAQAALNAAAEVEKLAQEKAARKAAKVAAAAATAEAARLAALAAAADDDDDDDAPVGVAGTPPKPTPPAPATVAAAGADDDEDDTPTIGKTAAGPSQAASAPKAAAAPAAPTVATDAAAAPAGLADLLTQWTTKK